MTHSGLISLLTTCILLSRIGSSFGTIIPNAVFSDTDQVDVLTSNPEFTDGALVDDMGEKRSLYPQYPVYGKIPGSSVSLTPKLKKLLDLLTQQINKNKLDVNGLRQFLSGDTKMNRQPQKPRYLYRFPFRRFGRQMQL